MTLIQHPSWKEQEVGRFIHDTTEYDTKIMMFPKYEDINSRWSTFQSWRVGFISTFDLADAGLFYTGKDDFVRCFTCGGGLNNWQQGDKPFEEHAKWFPKCHFVKKMTQKGKLNLPRKDEIPYSRSDQRPINGVGYNEDVADEQLKSLCDLESNCTIVTVESCNQEEINTNNKDKRYERPNSGSTTVLEQLLALVQENQDLKSRNMCIICKERKRDRLFSCGHLVSCHECSSRSVKCPSCGTHIHNVYPAFF